MVSGAAVDKGMGTTGVVAHHAADAAAVAGGGLGAEKEAKRFEEDVQFVAHHTWLYPCPTLSFVDFEDVVEVSADVYHDTIADNLARYAGAASTRNEMSVAATCFGDKLDNVFFVFGISHPERQLAIGGSIGGVGNAMKVVGKNLHVVVG